MLKTHLCVSVSTFNKKALIFPLGLRRESRRMPSALNSTPLFYFKTKGNDELLRLPLFQKSPLPEERLICGQYTWESTVPVRIASEDSSSPKNPQDPGQDLGWPAWAPAF